MESASSYAYLKKRAGKTASILRKQGEYGISNLEQDLDLNVFVLRFQKLKESEKSMGVGDPFFCSECKSCLNKFSKVLTKQEYENLFYNQEKVEKKQGEVEVEVEEKKQKLLQIPKNGSAWVCEFCGVHNSLMIEKEEIPVKEDIVYMLESANQKMEVESDNATTVVFCIDNSGSMNTTSEVTGKVDLKHGISEAELAMLKQFMEPGDEVQLNNMTGKTFVSRKQCVMAAIESQLSDIAKNDPNKKVGLITFNNEVVVFGDCSKDPVNILGDKLTKKENIVADVTPLKVESSVKESYEKMLGNFNKIEASGATALGPAILSAIELASKGKVGSTVVICTDGLANIGLGNFQGNIEQSKVFYAELAERAKNNNIAINIVSIKGEGCKLEALSVLAKETNGNVSIVSPDEIQSKFSNFLKDEIVATNVEVKIRLHKAVEFRNEFPENLHQNGTLLVKTLANATVKTKISFQYQLKTEDILKQLGVQMEKIKELPFQAQIIYTTTEGHRFIRVVTSALKTTENKKVVEQHVEKMKVIHERMGQQTAFMIEKEKPAGYSDYNMNYMNYLDDVAENAHHEQKAQLKTQQMDWAASKNRAVMKAGDNKKRKLQIKEIKKASQSKTKEEVHALQMEQKMIMEQQDEDMGGLFDAYK